MDYTMSSQPNISRGIAPESAPYSFSKEYKQTPAKTKKRKK